MADEKIKIEQHGGIGLLWIGGWLFTIGYSDLSFWQGIVAILVWPYFLGVDMASLAPPSAPS
ncbi:hypothetical protein [Chelativorans alearense]|uniref:hypothetical protein n=1 Tax=Chelativorans alearense TaxID=2681495 RepID=UPI0013CFF44B|nr:hypothetical protein [Chelativorans alearense]